MAVLNEGRGGSWLGTAYNGSARGKVEPLGDRVHLSMERASLTEGAMRRVLPAEFELGHELAFVFHDLLVRHIVEGENAGLLFFEVPLKYPEDAEAMKGLKGEEFWTWCEANGYRHVLDRHSYGNLI